VFSIECVLYRMCSLTEYIGLHSSVVHGVGVRCYTNALAYIHAYTHTHIHTYTRTHIHTYTHWHSSSTLALSLSLRAVHAHTRSCIHGARTRIQGHVFIARERHQKKNKTPVHAGGDVHRERERERERERRERDIERDRQTHFPAGWWRCRMPRTRRTMRPRRPTLFAKRRQALMRSRRRPMSTTTLGTYVHISSIYILYV
jgi:hypothetical protein